MSADFIGRLGPELLNNASRSIFPTIKPKLGDTTYVPELHLTVTWGASSPPTFDLNTGDPDQTFAVHMPVDLTIQPDGGKASTGTVDVAAKARATIDGNGVLHFSITDLSFATVDPLLLAVLNAKKHDIADKINALISAIAVPLGPIQGITFAGYAILIDGNAYAAGGLSAPVRIDRTPVIIGDAFNVLFSQALIQRVVDVLWWSTVEKTYSASGATVHLNGYNATVHDGQVVLNLYLSGDYSAGPATWDIDISPVTAVMRVVVDAQNNVRIDGGTVSRPSVDIKPSNFWAWMATLGAPVIMAITTAIIENVVEGKIQSSIQAQLNQTLLQIPELTGDFEGVTIKVVPQGLAISGQGNQITLSGTAAVSAS